MAYCAYTDVTYAIPTSVMSDLATKTGRTAQQLAEAAIADADAEIDLWNTSDWTTAQRLACSKALAIEMVYLIDSRSNPVPAHIKSAADKWRDLFQLQEENWTSVAYEPSQNETSEEIDTILQGDYGLTAD